MKNPLDFSGKTVLVVGGTTGIGNATARTFRDAGAKVWVWGTRPNAADYDKEEDSDLSGMIYQTMDATDYDRVREYQAEFDSLDVLVLSQGLVLYNRQEYEIDGFRRVVDVNLNSLMACAMRFHENLKNAGGSLIIVSSSAAFHATRGNPAYNASKTGAYGLCRTLAQAWAHQGVRVNGLAPGFIPTRMTAQTTENEKYKDAAMSRIPMGRFGTPDEMGSIALFLASPMSSYMTGQMLVADGGLLL